MSIAPASTSPTGNFCRVLVSAYIRAPLILHPTCALSNWFNHLSLLPGYLEIYEAVKLDKMLREWDIAYDFLLYSALEDTVIFIGV